VNTREIQPFTQNRTIAASTLQAFFSEPFTFNFQVGIIRIAFADNTQRFLRVRVVITDESSIAAVIPPPETHVPGLSLLGSWGGQDYVVGDGPEGELNIPIFKEFPAGLRVAVEGYNTDGASTHTLDVRVQLFQVIPYAN